MGNYLNIGNDGFAAMVKGTYVDKTEMISFINSTLGTMDKLTCVSRPRRFGKSYAAKMLCAYYDKSCDSRQLFAGLKIAGDESFEQHLNKYDVISIDMTLMIAGVENRKQIVGDIEKKIIGEVRETYPDVRQADGLIETLANVSENTKKQFIIIIDEWDALFREECNNIAVQEEYIKWLRRMFKSTLTDKAIIGAYMTGILPIKKYGTQSAMTDFHEYTMLQPEPLETYVGFTKEEVQTLCATSRVKFEALQKWYDGYLLGDNIHIYSPKSVMDALRRGRIGNYWTQSETYESLKWYIEMDKDGLKEAIVQMLGGAWIKIDTITFQNDMTTLKSRDDVLTLLVHLGYLSYDSDAEEVFIPNEEVRREFIRTVRSGGHREIVELIQNADMLLEDTIAMNEKAVASAIEKAHSAGTAPTFYNNEQALRSVVRFAYISCVDEYQEIQELPSGTGYADIVYVPKKMSKKPTMVIELKWNKTVAGAIQQIKDRNYPQILQGLSNEILLVGINYDENTKKHECRIERFKR